MHIESRQDTLRKATTVEWELSIFGACFIAFGLGVWLASYFRPWAFWIMLIGIIGHGWGMYKIHQRNR
jgi:hypothetical protein